MPQATTGGRARPENTSARRADHGELGEHRVRALGLDRLPDRGVLRGRGCDEDAVDGAATPRVPKVAHPPRPSRRARPGDRPAAGGPRQELRTGPPHRVGEAVAGEEPDAMARSREVLGDAEHRGDMPVRDVRSEQDGRHGCSPSRPGDVGE